MGASERALPSKVPHMSVRAGERFSCVGPAGGGYGDPLERDPADVLDDVLDEIISTNSARRDYAVVITDGQIDFDGTGAARAARRVAGNRATPGEE